MNEDRPLIPGRRVLSADELFDLKDASPRFERQRHFTTPGGEMGEKTPVWEFSIDGRLNGQSVQGALFANSVILIQAHTFDQAFLLARDGLAETIRLLREEYEARPAIPETVGSAGLATEGAGRKGRGDGTLRTDPKLKAMLAHIIGGLPWKW